MVSTVAAPAQPQNVVPAHGHPVSATSDFTGRISTRAGGIPPQFKEAFRRGTEQSIVTRWMEEGRPNSVRADRRRKRKDALPLLEHTADKSPAEPEAVSPAPGQSVIRMCAKQCRRAHCPCCRTKIGLRKRAEWMRTVERLSRWHPKGVLWMWTLTVDPKLYNDDHEAAHENITSRQLLTRLADRMGWKYWVSVLEWQESGNPHWHVLVYEPTNRPVYHDEATRKWAVGHVQYTRHDKDRRWSHLPVDQAALLCTSYITKYLVKPAKTPDWVLDSDRVIRTTSSSAKWRELQSSTRPESQKQTHSGAALDAPEEPDRQTHRDAMKNCGNGLVMLEEWINPRTGELRTRYLGEVAIPFRTFRRWTSRSALEHSELSERSLRCFRGSPDQRRILAELDRAVGELPPMLYYLIDQ